MPNGIDGSDSVDRVKQLLDETLDRPPAERDAFLVDACHGEPTLLAEVRDLLAVQMPVMDVLEAPAVWQIPTTDPDLIELEGLEGTEVGSYRLTRLLGSGGMGVVYLAERLGEVRGNVAIKLIKRGMDSAAVAVRFRYERQVLARLSHPNIAHFIDGGVTSGDRPYFVMEFVEGDSITRYAERHNLDLEARIRLFLQVLDAVAFAHQNLVVHRDLKPSNILVTEGGRPKLLDFGVAKVLGEDGDVGATLTRFGGRVLTPSYSSPEQIRGELVTTAADVYSLGVVLYELFVGRRPFELDRAPLHEVQDVVSHRAPTRPSLSLVDEPLPELDTKRLRRRLAGDLDMIVLKALRKEPEERYASARELHADLCRFLDGRPVLARKGSTAYRVRKFLGRHRTAAAVAGVLFLTTGVGGGLVLQQRGEATRHRLLAEQRVEDVRSLVNTLVFDVHDEVAALPGSTGARKLILDRAFEQLETVRRGLPEDADLLMSLAGVYRRLGDVQGNPTGPSLGDLTSARTSFSEGLALAERAIALDPDNLLRSRGLGLLHERYATVLANAGEVDEGVRGLQSAQQVYEKIAEAYPDSVRHQLTSVIGRINLSDHQGHPGFPNLGLTDQAVLGYQEAADRLARGVLGADSSSNVLRFRGLVQERLGRMLRFSGDLSGALSAENASLAVREALHAQNPANNDMHRDVGVSNQNRCSVLMLLGRTEEALVACGAAVEIYEDRLRLDPQNAGNLRDMALINRTYEELFLSAGDTARALHHLAEVVAWSDRRLELDETSLMARLDRVDALLTRALVRSARDEPLPDFVLVQTAVEGLRRDGHLSRGDSLRFATLQGARP